MAGFLCERNAELMSFMWQTRQCTYILFLIQRCLCIKYIFDYGIWLIHFFLEKIAARQAYTATRCKLVELLFSAKAFTTITHTKDASIDGVNTAYQLIVNRPISLSINNKWIDIIICIPIWSKHQHSTFDRLVHQHVVKIKVSLWLWSK